MSRKASTTTSASTATIGFEAKLWLTADKLRNNMDAAEYKHVVLHHQHNSERAELSQWLQLAAAISGHRQSVGFPGSVHWYF